MATSSSFAPAIKTRALFIFAVLAALLRAATPPSAPAPLAQIGKPDEAEAARILAQFRQSGIAGEYFLRFELHKLPRRGEEKVFRGQWWGSRNASGAVERIALIDADGRERRLLVQHGTEPAVWRLVDKRAEQLPIAAVAEPLIAGVDIAAFDLLMPFLAWPDVTVESVARMRGRPSHVFLFRPPPAFVASYGKIGWVRSYFDAQYGAPVQTEVLSPDGLVLKTLSLVDLKKVGEQWLVQSLDVRDEVTRDKTRLLVTGAALNLTLPPSVFEPAHLADDAKAPSPAAIVPLAP